MDDYCGDNELITLGVGTVNAITKVPQGWIRDNDEEDPF